MNEVHVIAIQVNGPDWALWEQSALLLAQTIEVHFVFPGTLDVEIHLNFSFSLKRL